MVEPTVTLSLCLTVAVQKLEMTESEFGLYAEFYSEHGRVGSNTTPLSSMDASLSSMDASLRELCCILLFPPRPFPPMTSLPPFPSCLLLQQGGFEFDLRVVKGRLRDVRCVVVSPSSCDCLAPHHGSLPDMRMGCPLFVAQGGDDRQ